MRIILPAIVVLVVAATVGAPDARAQDDLPLAEIRALLADAEAQGASGTVRIARDGEVLFEAGYGSASCDGEAPITPDHIFMIGSITKELTQVLGYVLEERGVLSRDDTLAKWLPDFDGPIGAVTIGQVIEHEAGLPDLIAADGEPVPYTIDYDYMPVSRDELLQRARLADLIYEPGTKTEYSNLGYQLLAAVYELATEKSFPELLHQYIYTPAGMAKTAFWFDDEPAELLVDGCLPGGARWGNPVEDRMWDESGPSWNLMGAGGLLSTAASLAAFLEGVGQDAYFETRDQAERYRTGRLVFSKNRQQLMMGPAGSNGIFNAVAVWLDGDRVSIVLLTNRADHPGEGGLVQEIARRVR